MEDNNCALLNFFLYFHNGTFHGRSELNEAVTYFPSNLLVRSCFPGPSVWQSSPGGGLQQGEVVR